MNNLSNLGLRLPRYQQLAQSLAERIERGDYQVGSLIPGEENLCVEHKLSRYTVREALRHLQDIGLVEKRHGVGTAVMAKTPQRMFSHTIGSVEQLQQYARATRLTGHQMQMVTADKALAAEFSCAPGDRFLRIEAMRVPVGAAGVHLHPPGGAIRRHQDAHQKRDTRHRKPHRGSIWRAHQRHRTAGQCCLD
jgi:DNA-binding GntR family transcriptional regulator